MCRHLNLLSSGVDELFPKAREMFMVRRKMVGMASSGLRRSVVIPAGLHGRAMSLGCLSAGNAAMPSDIISICIGQSVVPTAPHWLQSVVLPAVPLPPLPADDAAEDGVQATDSAAPSGSGATGSGLGANAGVRCSCLPPWKPSHMPS